MEKVKSSVQIWRSVYLTIGLKVLIILLTVQGINSKIAIELPDLSIVAEILQNLFKPSLRDSANLIIATSKVESTIATVINRKVKELEPFLQDYDNFEKVIEQNNQIIEKENKEYFNKLMDEYNNVELEGEDDTTIIEFDPNDDNDTQTKRRNDQITNGFKDNIIKYKIIRDKIKTELTEESVSINTQKLITQTFDDMLAIMVRSQCPANDQGYLARRASPTKDLTNDWTKQWKAIKDKYRNIFREHFSPQPNPARKLFMFFEQILEFLSIIMNDADHISNNYKVVCKLVKKDDNRDEVTFNNFDFLNYRTGKNKYNCPTFIMCSDELKHFMGVFYKNLNDTAVSTFRNYAAMYKTDTISDGSAEKESVIEGIDKLGNSIEQTITTIFKKASENFEIDHDKDRARNIEILSSFVSDTINKCLYAIKSYVNDTILHQRTRLILSLKQDLNSNINVELNNLAAELKEGICRAFSSCNGRTITRTSNDFDDEIKGKPQKSIDKNRVFVKLQINFDSDIKQNKTGGDVDIIAPMKNVARERTISVTNKINVTRTTQPDPIKLSDKTFHYENFGSTPTIERIKKELKKDTIENSFIKDKIKQISKDESYVKNWKKQNFDNYFTIQISKNKLKNSLKKGDSDKDSKKPEKILKKQRLENYLKTKKKLKKLEKLKNNLKTEKSAITKRTTSEFKSTLLYSRESSTEIIE